MTRHQRLAWGLLGALVLLGAIAHLQHGEDERSKAGGRVHTSPAPAGPELQGAISAQPARAPEHTTPASLGPELVTLITMDLGTRLPAPGVAWSWSEDAGAGTRSVDALSDVDGRIALPTTSLASLRVAAADWVLFRHSVEELRGTGRVWLARRLHLRIHVQRESESDGELDPTTVSVFVVPLVPLARVPAAAEEEDPGSVPWMQSHGLSWEPQPAQPDAVGIAVVQAIRIPGLAIKAQAPGWMASVTALEMPLDPSQSELRVQVFLHRSPRLRGRIVDADGRPVANAEVLAYTLREVSSWAYFRQNYSAFLIPGAAMGAHTGKDKRAYVNYAFPATTDADGNFVLDVRDPHGVTLVVHAPGLAPGRDAIGELTSDTTHDMSLARVPTARVRVTYRGQPHRGQSGTLVDATNEHQQTAVDISTDEHGDMPGEWLVVGRGYYFLIGPQDGKGFVRWDGRAQIELTELERSYERFYGYPE